MAGAAHAEGASGYGRARPSGLSAWLGVVSIRLTGRCAVEEAQVAVPWNISQTSGPDRMSVADSQWNPQQRLEYRPGTRAMRWDTTRNERFGVCGVS